jgi:Nucleotidyl transferase AbiEii toxin, Type IV TA system
VTRRVPKDIAASIRQRLQNEARKAARPFSEVLQYYAMERFLYRLSESSHADSFVLKGALMLIAWRSPQTRPTLDIDLLGRVSNSLRTIAAVIKDLCRQEVEPDGLHFDPASVTTARIAEDAGYEGVRAKFRGRLGTARVSMQIDVGFGDVVIPPPTLIDYPTLLDLPMPRLHTYSRETTIAEKLEAMIKLGSLNSRLKDFFDIWSLSRQFEFKGTILAEAISKTFAHRGTAIQAQPAGWSQDFLQDPRRIAQWRAFCRKALLNDIPTDFGEVVRSVADFLGPITRALAENQAFHSTWRPMGPWIPDAEAT